jgi:hypothetical protein
MINPPSFPHQVGPATSTTRTAIPHVASLTVDPERVAQMWSMTRAERVAAAQRGRFTLGEMLVWAARAPHEIFFITRLSADAAEGFD